MIITSTNPNQSHITNNLCSLQFDNYCINLFIFSSWWVIRYRLSNLSITSIFYNEWKNIDNIQETKQFIFICWWYWSPIGSWAINWFDIKYINHCQYWLWIKRYRISNTTNIDIDSLFILNDNMNKYRLFVLSHCF